MKAFSNEEYLRLLQRLDGRHAVFYHLWIAGKPRFSDISTAAVGFDEEGEQVDFQLGYEFWNTLNDNQKLFVICHECLHIILQHGPRFFRNNKLDHGLSNKATDVAINHLCVNRLGFDREEIDPDNIYCWNDTVFSGDDIPPDDKSAESYYRRLKKDGSNEECPNQTVDEHSTGDDQALENVLKDINDKLTPEEKQFIKELLDDQEESKSKQAGTGSSDIWTFVDTKPVKKKQKWETVIKKWAMQYMRQSSKEESQWARLNRRFTLLPDDMFIPTEMEIEEREVKEERIQVWFFQDTSGSCSGYRQRFFDAAKSLPEDRFDVRMFCFDDNVFETSLESGKLYGFGGTCFKVIETAIQNTIKSEKTGYPKAVFVITDGWGTFVHPEKPDNWYWFLTPGGTKSYIPDNSHTFDLADFE